MHALKIWNGGVILISHDERFITTVATEVRIYARSTTLTLVLIFQQLWVCGEGSVTKFMGDVQAYKVT